MIEDIGKKKREAKENVRDIHNRGNQGEDGCEIRSLSLMDWNSHMLPDLDLKVPSLLAIED